MPSASTFLYAFLIGGLLCVLAQLVVDVIKLTPASTMVLFVSLGAIASGIGLYEPLTKFAGAGATVPLPGFGHVLVQGISEGMSKKGFMGLFAGGLEAAAMALTVAIIIGYLTSVLFNPKG